MTALSNDRQASEMCGNGPAGFLAGTPTTFNVYFDQLLTLGGDALLRPASTSTAAMSGSVCVGLSQHTNFNITSTTPLPEGQLTYKTGVFNFANDTVNPVTVDTLPGTLLFAVDDQTLSLSQSTGQRAVAGRLVRFVSGSQYPVFAAVGPTTSVSGSTV